MSNDLLEQAILLHFIVTFRPVLVIGSLVSIGLRRTYTIL